MVIFTREIEGVVITDNDTPIQTDINIVRGHEKMNKSRKPQNFDKAPSLSRKKNENITQELLQNQRQEREKLRDLNKTLKQMKEQRREKLKQRRQQKKEQEEQNQIKGTQFQVIKDNSKIRKWSKKSKEKLMKMPKEMFEKFLNSTRQV